MKFQTKLFDQTAISTVFVAVAQKLGGGPGQCGRVFPNALYYYCIELVKPKGFLPNLYCHCYFNWVTQPRPQVHIFGTKIDQFPNEIHNLFAQYFSNIKFPSNFKT
jgi:hypothetical protein